MAGDLGSTTRLDLSWHRQLEAAVLAALDVDAADVCDVDRR